MQIGDLSVRNRIWLAPLAGITIASVRRFFVRLGVGMVHTEMISATGLVRGGRKTRNMLEARRPTILEGYQAFGDDRDSVPLVVQLFAGDADTLLRAGGMILESGARCDAFGINMACPMPKILKRGAGARLLEHPAIAAEMTKNLKRLGAPVWGKIRLSPSGYPLSTEDFCRLLLDAGADNICVHGRTPAQRYEGVADSGEVERIADLFPGYISASGDVFSPEDAVRYCRAGCVGVMAARGAMRDPFMIPAAVAALDDRSRNDAPSVDPAPDCETRRDILIRLGDETAEERGASVALVMVKRFAGGVFRGLRGAGEVRRSIACAADWREVRGILETCASCFEYRERGVEMYGREAE